MASEYTYDAQVMQNAVNNQPEPAYQTRIINTLNKQCAQNKSGLVLRQPQPNPICHCLMMNYKWTAEEASAFLDQGILPLDLTTIHTSEDGAAVLLWIFDASHTGGVLPEIELDPLPNFQEHPALCIFDMDGQDTTALIPSEFLEMVPNGSKVQFVLKDEVGDIAQFANRGGAPGGVL